MAKIDTRTARGKLTHRKAPYWHVLEPGLAVGYHRPKSGAGAWWVRALIDGTHRMAALGTADDLADGAGLNWKQAQAAARDWLKQQTTSVSAEAPLTVTAAIENYAADLRARKGERPAQELLGRMRRHLLPVLGERQLTELTTAELTSWRNSLSDLDGDEDDFRRSRDTANRLLTMARGAFNHAFSTGRVADDRAWRRVKPFHDVGEARKVILSESEIQRLIDACEPGLRELVALGAMTGARLGELTTAKVRDLDQGAAKLVVRGKTGARPITLPPAAVTLCARLVAGKRPSEHLLTTAREFPWTASLHARPFAAAVAKAGLDPETVFYSLRHSYISRALVAGVPTKAVADHCGTSIAMLQRYYAKFIPTDMARYAEMAAPAISVDAPAAKVVPLRR
jgi:integrase